MLDPLVVSDALRQMKQFYQRDRIVAYYPSETECTVAGCGHDTITNSKRKIGCRACDERGYVTTWSTQTLVVRAVRPEPLTFSFRDNILVAETADLILYVDATNRTTIEYIRAEARAYLSIDNIDYRPTAITPIGVGNVAEYRVECAIYTPD